MRTSLLAALSCVLVSSALHAQDTPAADTAAIDPLPVGTLVRVDLMLQVGPASAVGRVRALKDANGCLDLLLHHSSEVTSFAVRVSESLTLQHAPGATDADPSSPSLRWTAVQGAALAQAGITCIQGNRL